MRYLLITLLMFTAPLSWGEDSSSDWYEGDAWCFLAVADNSTGKFYEALKKAGCVEGDRIYIPTHYRPEIQDSLIMNFCNLDSGFAKLSAGYTCIYHGGRRSTKQNGIVLDYK